jgi:hypothetical protein
MPKVCVPIIETTVEKARHRADLMEIKKELYQVLGIEINREKNFD